MRLLPIARSTAPFVSLLVAATLALSGCGAPPAEDMEETETPEPPSAVESAGLVGSWTVVALDGEAVDLAEAPTLEIAADGSVSGFGGVNQFHTSLELTDGRIRFGPGASTRMAGPPEAMAFEQLYFERLGAIGTFEVSDGRLRLWAGDNEALTLEAQ